MCFGTAKAPAGVRCVDVNARVIVISGSMGSGKTTVLGEASDVLSVCRLAHATVDLDAVGTALLPDDVSRDLIYRNLEANHE
jgi:adenylate kinase